MLDIISVGSASLDVFLSTEYCRKIKQKSQGQPCALQAYPIGGKILVNELLFTTGGGGTNTAVSFSRLGFRAGYLGMLGADHNARLIRDELKRENIRDFSLKQNKGITGYSVILDSHEHDRTIFTYKGVNNSLRWGELPLNSLKARWFYFSTLLGTSFEAQKKLAIWAKQRGSRIAFNISSYLAKKGIPFIKDILSRTTIFVLNEEESITLSKEKDRKKRFHILHKLGIPLIVITNGRHGATASDNNKLYSIIPKQVKVIETTGAGDAFASSFLAGIWRKNDIPFALQLAQANANSVIRHHGAKNILLTWPQALKEIKKKPWRIRISSF
ncbi:carbohydrate kinase family protein [Candidatus Woesearchaeota archaeon]|nr:carbohydrate kinase family protein [Candidatus Woesearchaeota archaeon]